MRQGGTWKIPQAQAVSFLKVFMPNEITIERKTPRLFAKKAIATNNAYGIFAILPVLIAIFSISLIERLFDENLAFGLGIAILVLAAVVPVYFFPIAIGNPHIRQLFRSLNTTNKNGFTVQLTNLPRAKSGFFALMEDADDIGLLTIEDQALIFNGDSTKFLIPFSLIKNVGWRGLWIYGNRIIIDVSNLSFEFAERFSLSIPTSRKISKELFKGLLMKIQK